MNSRFSKSIFITYLTDYSFFKKFGDECPWPGKFIAAVKDFVEVS